MDGEMSLDEFNLALDLGLQGCEKIYELQKQILKEKYASMSEAVAVGSHGKE
jgi:hypothetical protein